MTLFNPRISKPTPPAQTCLLSSSSICLCIFKNPTEKSNWTCEYRSHHFPQQTYSSSSVLSLYKEIPSTQLLKPRKLIVLATHPLLHIQQSLVPVILRLGSLTLKSVRFFLSTAAKQDVGPAIIILAWTLVSAPASSSLLVFTLALHAVCLVRLPGMVHSLSLKSVNDPLHPWDLLQVA